MTTQLQRGKTVKKGTLPQYKQIKRKNNYSLLDIINK